MAIDFPSSPTNGQEFSSGSVTWTYDGTAWNLKSTAATTNDSMPVGSIMWFAVTTPTPTGWLAADGSNVSRTTYAALFAVIGTTHGSGDGSTTFGLPNISATTGKYFIRYTTAVGVQTTTALSSAPVGTLFDWPVTSSYPTGFLRADGTAVSRTTYADLFALIGTTYGTGDGSTTFNLPNILAAGSGSPVAIIKATLSGITEPSTVAHASTHNQGGSDPVSIGMSQISGLQTHRNALINGSMAVAQRGTSFTSTSSPANNDDTYLLDRWTLLSDGNDAVDVTQSTDAPTGLKYSCALDVETANKKFGIIQFIENQNIPPLVGNTVTLSFWAKTTGSSISDVKASVLSWTGTADSVTSDVVSAWNASGTAPTLVANWTAENTPANLNVTSSWVRYSLTAVLDTASTTNVAVFIWCDDASTTIGDFLYVTGVQLEVGSVSTPFEFLPFGDELARCQRYYNRWGGSDLYEVIGFGTGASTTTVYVHLVTPVEMRAVPIGDYSTLRFDDGVNAGIAVTSFASIFSDGRKSMVLDMKAGAGVTQYRPYFLQTNNSLSGFLSLSAEL